MIVSVGDCIETFTGKMVDVFNLKQEDIDIEDIAHALSQQTRFSGHLPQFYSVAQHCVLGLEFAQDHDKLAWLLHDASEAYLMDMPTPIKKRFPEYKKLEKEIQRKIYTKFNVFHVNEAVIKEIDHFMFRWEYERLMHNDKSMRVIRSVNPMEIKFQFLNEYRKLAR